MDENLGLNCKEFALGDKAVEKKTGGWIGGGEMWLVPDFGTSAIAAGKVRRMASGVSFLRLEIGWKQKISHSNYRPLITLGSAAGIPRLPGPVACRLFGIPRWCLQECSMVFPESQKEPSCRGMRPSCY